MLVKLQRPPPEIRIFLPIRSACSSTATRRPRLPASMAQSSPAAPPPRTKASNLRIKNESHLIRKQPPAEFSSPSLSRLNYVQEKTEKIASDYQRARIGEEVRRRPALPEHFFYRLRRGSHRRDRAEWLGQVDVAGDAHRQHQAGQRRCGDSQGHAAELRLADFGVFSGRDDSLGHRDRSRTNGRSRSRARLTFCRNAGPRGFYGS